MSQSKRAITLSKVVDPSAGPRAHDSEVFATGKDPMRDMAPVSGAPFRAQLADLAAGRREAVMLQTSLPVHYAATRARPTDLSKSMDLPISYAYTRKVHASTRSGTEWTQGWMEPATGTEWAQMLPEKLSMEGATDTLRAVKAIMGHDVKPKRLPGITTKATANVMAKPAIRPAVTSFVEDVTGELAGTTRHTGSAIRAAYLRAKLQMKNEGKTEAPGFRKHVMDTFSQLKSGGAADLARTIHGELTAGPASATAAAYAASARTEHDLLYDTIHARFATKHKDYLAMQAKGASSADIGTRLGDWWAAADRSDAGTARGQYVTHKYGKHGIG